MILGECAFSLHPIINSGLIPGGQNSSKRQTVFFLPVDPRDLLRHSQQVHQEEDGAVHFWRIKENHQNPFPQSVHWSDSRWKACLAAGGGVKRRFQYCTDDSGIIIYLRALQGHSGRNLIDLSLQDNVVIPSGFFQHIYLWFCFCLRSACKIFCTQFERTFFELIFGDFCFVVPY